MKRKTKPKQKTESEFEHMYMSVFDGKKTITFLHSYGATASFAKKLAKILIESNVAHTVNFRMGEDVKANCFTRKGK